MVKCEAIISMARSTAVLCAKTPHSTASVFAACPPKGGVGERRNYTLTCLLSTENITLRTFTTSCKATHFREKAMNVKFKGIKDFSSPHPALLTGGDGGSPVPTALLSLKRAVGICTGFLSAVTGTSKTPPLLMGSLKEDQEGKRGCGGHSPTQPAPRGQPCPVKWKPLQEPV